MKTWVLWTHYDCDVYATLHASELDAWLNLRDNWLDGCDDECGHDDPSTAEEIRNAVEWHYDSELSYSISPHDVPTSVAPLDPVRVSRPPDRNTMPAATADGLLSSLESFKEKT